MNLEAARYDPDLQMFADPPGEPDRTRLGFLRWLAERGRLEHEAAGSPCGEYADRGAERHRGARPEAPPAAAPSGGRV